MEVGKSNIGSNIEKKPLESPTAANKGKKPVEKIVNSSTFVNHAAIAWQESRSKWVGDQSRRSRRTNNKDPIISWSTTYDELLSTNEPFLERISLTEMVDFLVDIWQDEGLFD